MISMMRLSPCAQESIDRRTQAKLQEFSIMGIDSRLDIISIENCEYVARLFAVEKTFVNYQRSAHDREIVLRVCDQFRVSGIPELREWAIAELHQNKDQLRQQIADCQGAIVQILEKLRWLTTERDIMNDLDCCLCDESITLDEFLSGYDWMAEEEQQIYASVLTQMQKEGKLLVDDIGYLSWA